MAWEAGRLFLLGLQHDSCIHQCVREKEVHTHPPHATPPRPTLLAPPWDCSL
jgi:hypothetical protein